jgi:hypothetical protein
LCHSISGRSGGKAIDLSGETSVRVVGGEAMAAQKGKPRSKFAVIERQPGLPADLA